MDTVKDHQTHIGGIFSTLIDFASQNHPAPVVVVSVGSGSGRNEIILKEALDKHYKRPAPFEFVLVDPLEHGVYCASHGYSQSLSPAWEPHFATTQSLVKKRPELVGAPTTVVVLFRATPGDLYGIDALNRLDPALVLRTTTYGWGYGYAQGCELSACREWDYISVPQAVRAKANMALDVSGTSRAKPDAWLERSYRVVPRWSRVSVGEVEFDGATSYLEALVPFSSEPVVVLPIQGGNTALLYCTRLDETWDEGVDFANSMYYQPMSPHPDKWSALQLIEDPEEDELDVDPALARLVDLLNALGRWRRAFCRIGLGRFFDTVLFLKLLRR